MLDDENWWTDKDMPIDGGGGGEEEKEDDDGILPVPVVAGGAEYGAGRG